MSLSLMLEILEETKKCYVGDLDNLDQLLNDLEVKGYFCHFESTDRDYIVLDEKLVPFILVFANDTAHMVYAKDENEARELIIKHYQGDWMTVYTEEEWENLDKKEYFTMIPFKMIKMSGSNV